MKVVADKQFCRYVWAGCSQCKNVLSILGWWVCQPLIKAVSKGSFMVLGFILEPSFDDMMLKSAYEAPIPKQKKAQKTMGRVCRCSSRNQSVFISSL